MNLGVFNDEKFVADVACPQTAFAVLGNEPLRPRKLSLPVQILVAFRFTGASGSTGLSGFEGAASPRRRLTTALEIGAGAQ
jgi:hypothetical protein